MKKSNIEMLQTIASGLEELKDQVVFVGGATAELYVDNPAASDIRPTIDIDCIIEVSTKSKYYEFERKLETKGFSHDTSSGAPICRWVYRNVIVDVMPLEEDILGFSNVWYKEGFNKKINTKLPDNTDIFIFPLEYYLTAKFEAHSGRGGTDLRQSRDFEDIIYLLDNCTHLIDTLTKSEESVNEYLKKKCRVLLDNNNLIEGIESALPYGSDSDSTEIIFELIQYIANLE